ncbi:MAG: WhiB family transcriptional regulator, partial [Actinomycetota bacterium]
MRRHAVSAARAPGLDRTRAGAGRPRRGGHGRHGPASAAQAPGPAERSNCLWRAGPADPRFRVVGRGGQLQALGAVDVVSAKEIQWRELGACRGLDPTIFYPDDDDDAADAKDVCAECGVR